MLKNLLVSVLVLLSSLGLAILLLLFPSLALAAPDITGVTGTMSHGQSVTIGGTQFGIKNPAKPLLWDDGDHPGYYNSAYFMTHDVPSRIGTFSLIGNQYLRYWLPQYRQYPFRTINPPHTNTNGGVWAGGTMQKMEYGSNLGNVFTQFDTGGDPSVWYIIFYAATDPYFPVDDLQRDPRITSPNGRNYKSELFDETGHDSTHHLWLWHNSGNGAFEDSTWQADNAPTLYTGEIGLYLCTPGDAATDAGMYANYDHRPEEFRQWIHKEVTVRRDAPGWGINRALPNSPSWTYSSSKINEDYCPPTREWYGFADALRKLAIGTWFRYGQLDDGGPVYWTNNVLGANYFQWLPADNNPNAYYLQGLSPYYEANGRPYCSSGMSHVYMPGCEPATRASSVATMGTCDYWVGDDDGLGYSTLYVRTIDSGDPDSFAGTDVLSDTVSTYNLVAGGPNAYTHNDAWQYREDIYLDNTFSRVMLANNPVFNSAYIIEPQIPSAWSSTSITVEINRGAITDNTAWLYVFDGDNQPSAAYTVTFGEEEEPPTVPRPPNSTYFFRFR